MRCHIHCDIGLIVVASAMLLCQPAVGQGEDPLRHGRGGGPDLAVRTIKALHVLKHKGESSFAVTLNNAVIVNTYAGNTPKAEKRNAWVHRNGNGRIVGIYNKNTSMMHAPGDGFSVEKITVKGTGLTNRQEPSHASSQEYDKFMVTLVEDRYGPMMNSGGKNIFGARTGRSELLKEGVRVTAEDLVYEKGVKIFFDDRILMKALRRKLDDTAVSQLVKLGHALTTAKDLKEVDRVYRSFVDSSKTAFVRKNKKTVEKKDVVLVSLKNLLKQAKKGENLPRSVKDLGGITRVHGFILVPRTKDVVLVGSAKQGVPALGIDNLIVALRHVWREGKTPSVSLDPDVTNHLGPQRVRVGGIPKNSRFARIMLDADYLAKRLVLGDPSTGVTMPSLITLPKALEALAEFPSNASHSRLWLTPVQPKEGDIQVSSAEDVVLFETGVHVLTEKMHVANSCLVGTGTTEPASEKAIRSLTKHYEQIAKQKPVFEQLHGLFDLVLLSKILYQLNVNSPALGAIADLRLETCNVPDSYRAVVMHYYDRRKHRAIGLSGGVVTRGYLGLQHQLHYDTSVLTRLRKAASSLSDGDRITSSIKDLRLLLVAPSKQHRYLVEATAVLAAGQYRRAEKLFSVVIKSDPFLGEAYVQRSHARVNLKDMKGARKDIEQAITLLPTERFLRVIRFVLLLQIGVEPEKIEADPNVKSEVANIIYENTIYVHRHGAVKESAASLDLVLKLDPKHADAYALRGWIKLRLGKYKAAHDDASRALKLAPKSAQAYTVRGAAGLALGPDDDDYYEDAYDDFTMAVKLAPDVPEWWYNRASVMDVWGNTVERDTDLARGHEVAIQHYTRLLKLHKGKPILYVRRGEANTRAQKIKEAIKDYDAAINKNGKMVIAYVKRAGAWHTLEQYGKAVRDASKAIELAPKDAKAYAARGAGHYKLGRTKDALSDCNKAIGLDPKLQYGYHIRALVRLALGDRTRAISDWKKAIDLDPANKGLYQQMIDKASRARGR